MKNNNITELPEWIGELKLLSIINMSGNRIKYVPDSISELDPENGGSLWRLSLDNSVSDDVYEKLTYLLPNVNISTIR